jgi:hypothetical protein
MSVGSPSELPISEMPAGISPEMSEISAGILPGV